MEENYETVRKYVERLEAISVENGNILTGKTGRFSFIGDWVAPGRGMDSKNMPSHEAHEIFNNCYRIYHMQLYMKMAAVLGQTEEVDKYQTVIEKIRPLIHKEFYDKDSGTYVYDQQAYYILPLMTGVVPDNLRAKVLKDLETNILVTRRGHLDTGLLGTYFLIEYLREIGRNDLVYTMFSKTTYPSWGYMLEQGATTVWEQWNGYWSHMSRTSLGKGNCSISSERYRYISYLDGSEEFYDLRKDPHEWKNLIADESLQKEIEKHRKQLPVEMADILGSGSTGHKAYNASGLLIIP